MGTGRVGSWRGGRHRRGSVPCLAKRSRAASVGLKAGRICGFICASSRLTNFLVMKSYWIKTTLTVAAALLLAANLTAQRHGPAAAAEPATLLLAQPGSEPLTVRIFNLIHYDVERGELAALAAGSRTSRRRQSAGSRALGAGRRARTATRARACDGHPGVSYTQYTTS